MAIPHKFIKMKPHKDAFVCSCGRTTYALFPGKKCSKCFDFEAEKEKAISRQMTSEEKKRKRENYLRRKAGLAKKRKIRKEAA